MARTNITPVRKSEEITFQSDAPDGIMSIVGAEESFDFVETGLNLTPYAVIAEPMSESTWKRILSTNPDADRGDWYFMPPHPDKPIRLYVLDFTVLFQHQYWTIEEDGKVLGTYASDPNDDNSRLIFDVMGLAFNIEERCWPCRITFKRTKCGGIQQYLQNATLAGKEPEVWAEQSDAHRATLGIDDWRLRLFGQFKTSQKTAGSGFKYFTCECGVKPMASREWKQYQALLADEEMRELTTKTKDAFDLRRSRTVEAITRTEAPSTK